MSRGAPVASSSGAYGAPLEVVADEGRDLQLPRLKPPRPRQATKRWHLIAPLRLVPLVLATLMLRLLCRVPALTSRAWASSA